MRCYLGIDCGTSGVKAVVVDDVGNVLGRGFREVSLYTPKPGWAEQDPDEWWRACVSAVIQALEESGSADDVAAAGVSGQMLGSVLVDKSGEPADRCIIWLDQRAARERDLIESKIGLERILDITANFPLTSYWAPKLLWLKGNRPDIYRKTDKILFPKDYINFRLTSEMASDVTDAAGTVLFDNHRRIWSDELFGRLGISRDIVCDKAVESVEIIGRVTDAAASELGISKGTPVVAGAGDQIAGGVGNGVVKPGIVSSTIGTSGVVFACTDTCITDRKPRAALSYCHALPGKWCFFGCTLAAGGSYKWLRDNVIARSNEALGGRSSVFEWMDAKAGLARPGSEGLLFLPYLNGERTPYPDPDARGVFFGLSYRHGLNEMCRSVMEGVVFSLRDTVEILREYGMDVREVRASGGGAKSRLWLQMQADIFNSDVVTMKAEEGPAFGAAILAASGTGDFSSVEEACSAMVKIAGRIEPAKGNVETYQDFYGTYRSLYPALREIFARQAEKVQKWQR